ncbi:helix-turn-helix transcriptional regulator [Dokdonella sp.]|uniref:helix-turn-helix transcriptional regulator n=1 Tax=Dokdonella sp. TaxID=2291710 RepID=UPI003527F22C
MRRADRLFLIIHSLRGRRTALPARQLAETLAVSLRTIYRDIADLQLSGVPIEGEAGVGYLLRKGSDIPPLMFNAEELEALVVGTRFVRAFAGTRLAAGARSALIKIEAVLPDEQRARAQRSRIFAPGGWQTSAPLIDRLNEAIEQRRVIGLDYRDEAGKASAREVEPLCLAFWGGSWTLGAWCRMREDFRNFRPDRIIALELRSERFADCPEHGFDAYLRAIGADPITDTGQR